MIYTFSYYYFIFYIAPGGSVQEEGEKATWRTTVCVFEANDDELKTYVQVYTVDCVSLVSKDTVLLQFSSLQFILFCNKYTIYKIWNKKARKLLKKSLGLWAMSSLKMKQK